MNGNRRLYRTCLIIICCLVGGFCAYTQPPQKVNSNYQFKSVGADSGGVRLPKYTALPGLPNLSYIDTGAIAYRKTDSTWWGWTGNVWKQIGAGGTTGFQQTMTNNRNLSNSDSVLMNTFDLYFKNGKVKADSIELPQTTSSGKGVLYQNGQRLISSYDPSATGNGGFNLFIGRNAGSLSIPPAGNDSGSLNIGIGKDVFNSITSAHENSVVGNEALSPCTNCLGNAGIGETILSHCTTCIDNIAVGAHALNLLTTGNNNVALGYRNQEFNLTGNDNVSSGWWSLKALTTGSFNIAFGTHAGWSITNGQANVFAGYNSGSSGNFNFNTGIGYGTLNAVVDGDNNTAVGVEAGDNAGATHDNQNAYFGGQSGRDATAVGTLVNAGAFGYHARVAVSNAIAIGDVGISTVIGAVAPCATCALDVPSSTRGFAPPRMTTTQKLAIASPVEGLRVYDLTLHNNSTYNGSAWLDQKRIISNSFSQVGTATTVFTVTIGSTLPSAVYQVNLTATAALSAAAYYVTNKTTTTFDVTYLAGLTGTVTFDWSLYQ